MFKCVVRKIDVKCDISCVATASVKKKVSGIVRPSVSDDVRHRLGMLYTKSLMVKCNCSGYTAHGVILLILL